MSIIKRFSKINYLYFDTGIIIILILFTHSKLQSSTEKEFRHCSFLLLGPASSWCSDPKEKLLQEYQTSGLIQQVQVLWLHECKISYETSLLGNSSVAILWFSMPVSWRWRSNPQSQDFREENPGNAISCGVLHCFWQRSVLPFSTITGPLYPWSLHPRVQ